MGEANYIPSVIDKAVGAEDEKGDFNTAITLVERLRQKLHELLHLVLDNADVTDITSVQALLLYNLGDHEIMVGELKARGFYLGSNVSYNLKKLVNLGYVAQEPSPHDRRAARVSLTIKGHRIRKIIATFYDSDIENILASCRLNYQDIRQMVEVLKVWDQLWGLELVEQSKPRV